MKRHYSGDEPDQQVINYPALLNEAQLRAVMHLNGPHLVIAGAGTGKTRTLVYRVAYLVDQGIEPRSILLLTFTRKSAQEMMHRASLIRDERCADIAGGTFHSFGNMILRRYGRTLGYDSNFTILDRSDAEEILGMLRTELGFHQLKTRFPRKEALMNIISRSVNTGKEVADIVDEEYVQFFPEVPGILKLAEAYAQFKLAKSVMDYDDLLVNLKRLLAEYESIRVKLSDTYQYLMVDEYQDTNRLQADIVRLLASEHHNVMVVGDDAQSIYAFRGADFRNIMDFPKHFPGCVVTTLEQNYRSSQHILSLTNAIIANAREKYTKELFSAIDSGQKPHYLRPRSEYDEARFVSLEIAELVRKGAKLADIAVLFRSGWHSNILEVELAAHRLPFVKYGGIKFVEAAHVKDVLAFLRIGFNPLDAIAWRRVLLLLNGIGAVTANRIIKKVVDEGEGCDALLSKAFSNKNYGDELRELHGLISRLIVDEIDLGEEIRMVLEFYGPYFEEKFDDFKGRANDLTSLLQIAERYESVEKFLSDLTLESPEQSLVKRATANPESDRLVLSTIHSAKGLEWESVFLIHLVDGCLPSSYSLMKEESIEEERRLFYVATTRAKQGLYLLAPRLQGGRFYDSCGGPSRFLFEMTDLNRLAQKR